jgi:hypothetical protein
MSQGSILVLSVAAGLAGLPYSYLEMDIMTISEGEVSV